ncbi:MAG TPA: PAS domain-containing sensor histidine kinase [Gemmatimonadaceae bacterium]|nr:PAS domain-containing sensor histidine kinase [Gemmatimonadaceae bacterium]
MSDSDASGDRPARAPVQRPPRPSVAEREAASFANAGPTPGGVGQAVGLYQLLVESVSDYAIFALDPTGVILSWNSGAARIKGYAAEEVIGRHFSMFYPPDALAADKPGLELRIAARDGRVEDEGWRLRKDGTHFWASVVVTALRDPQGHLVGFAKVTRDLTERRAAVERLRSSEERLRVLIQSVRDYGIFMLDPDGRVASWNEGARRIKGYEAEEIVGRHFSVFYPDAARLSGFPDHELEVAREVGRFEDEGWRVRKDGTQFWANVVITALFGDDGSLLGFAKVTRDLTERRLAQQREVEDARRVADAEASSRAKSGFLAAMSHELRTPLNAISGYAQLMLEGIAGAVSDQQREYLSRIIVSQQHLLAIVNDLLNYSRIEAGELTYEREPVVMREVLERVLAMVTPQAERKRLRLSLGTCDTAVAALADQLKTEQIVLNLISNAVKFTPEGGSVTLSCGRQDGGATIEVRDTGPGIPHEMQQAIFEPFVQLGRTLTSTHEGAGLGLAICRDLARAMGGDVSVESTLGAGATFVLRLPAA